jgi:hypothetical protein
MPGIDNFIDQIVQAFPFAAAIPGLFANSGYNVVSAHRTGYAPAASVASVNLRPGTFAQQAAAAQRSLVSTSANDTAAGTGARTILINYLNNSMVLKQDTVILNGLTAVNTNATDIQFIESMVVASCGTDVTNDGVISMMTGLAGAGSAMAQIAALDGSTFFAHHYVQPGVNCYILKHTGSGTIAAGRSLMVHTGDPRTTAPVLQVGDIFCHLAGAADDHEYISPQVITGPDLIIAREFPISAVAGNLGYGGFDYVEF